MQNTESTNISKGLRLSETLVNTSTKGVTNKAYTVRVFTRKDQIWGRVFSCRMMYHFHWLS